MKNQSPTLVNVDQAFDANHLNDLQLTCKEIKSLIKQIDNLSAIRKVGYLSLRKALVEKYNKRQANDWAFFQKCLKTL